MNIVWPDNTTEIIDKIRGAIGRDVTFYVVASSTPCPTCSLDPITNESTDSFCPTCSGIYWIPVYSGYTVSGHITWGNMDTLQWITTGQYFDGNARVQIKYTPESLSIVEQTQDSGYVVVDNESMEIKSILLRGVKNINRILINLIKKER